MCTGQGSVGESGKRGLVAMWGLMAWKGGKEAGLRGLRLDSEVGCCDIKSSRVELGFRLCDGVVDEGVNGYEDQGEISLLIA
jgi:hypothetical protein